MKRKQDIRNDQHNSMELRTIKIRGSNISTCKNTDDEDHQKTNKLGCKELDRLVHLMDCKYEVDTW